MGARGSVSSFLPKSVIQLISSNEPFGLLKGSVLFADVAGFTPLTEALMVLGKEGSEELTRILNGYFTEMIRTVEDYEGDVLRFAGDAMTVFFEGDEGRICASCALAMLAKMEKFQEIPT